MNQPIPMPAPFGGVNEQIPVAAIESPYCENLLNFNATQAGLELRHGDSIHRKISDASRDPLNLVPYGTAAMFIASYNQNDSKIYFLNASSGAVVHSSTALGQDNFYPLQFNKYLFFFSAQVYAPGFYYNGSAWGSIGYTGSGLLPAGGAVFKHRAYIVQSLESAYWYSDIDAISGALHKVDLSSLVTDVTYLVAIARVTLADTVEAQSLLAFIFKSGEVIFYDGSYPDSFDWREVGRGNIGEPFSARTGFPYKGDYFALTRAGVFSLRDLFLKGSNQANSLAINSRIEKTWKSLAAELSGGSYNEARGIYDSVNDRIIINMPLYPDPSGPTIGAFFFVFDCVRQSWFFHQAFGGAAVFGTSIDVCYFNKSVYFLMTVFNGTMVVYKKEGATGYSDRKWDDTTEQGFDYEIKSAPLLNGRAFVAKCEGLDVITESDLHDQTNYQLISDLGRDTTAAQKLPSDTPTSLQKPNVNMGIEGTYIQYKISGTTVASKTVGMKLYGVNAWISQGRSPR